MPNELHRDEVRRLIADGAQLVEVLPADEYEAEHIPGAINIPLKTLDRQTTAQLRSDQPVIVYCHDYQWDISPRAACRLESLGFTHVFDYVAGKADWFASGLPRAGKEAARPRAGDIARRDVPTCRLTDRIGDVQKRVQAAGWTLCIVVSDSGVVLGRLRQKTLAADPESIVETVMESGPSTIRPDVLLESIMERMRKRNVDNTVVTTSDGRLVGILYRGDAEQYLDNFDPRTKAQP